MRAPRWLRDQKARSDRPTWSAGADLRQPTFDDFSGAPRASSDVSLPTQMANGAFVVRPPFPPAFAIETRPRPARCGYLGCWRVGQADRTLTLRAGNLHGIPSTALPHSRRCFPTAPTAEPAAPPTHKIRLLADAPAINGLGLSARKRVDRRTVGQCNLSGSTPFRISGKPAAWPVNSRGTWTGWLASN